MTFNLLLKSTHTSAATAFALLDRHLCPWSFTDGL